jgi:hypothetical protein
MLKFLRHIICRMLDFYRRTWQVFFGLFGALLLGAIQIVVWLNDQWYMPLMAISVSILALICLMMALIGYINDYRDARRKEIRKALREAVKRLNPEYTEEQIDWWVNGK